ncbi:MAG: hypothetical protein V1736_04155 [Pseudomonadota bacterium]
MMKCKGYIEVCIVTFLVIFSLSSTACAATYYVDAVSGSDSNAGTSQTSAWKTVAKAGSSSVKPGDVVHFKRGCTWNETLKPVSGQSGNVVSYGAYGSGNKPVISSFTATSKSYIKAQDIEFRNNSGSYPLIIDRSNHVTVQSCNIYGGAGCTVWAALRIIDSDHNNVVSCDIKHMNTSKLNDCVSVKRSNYNLLEGNEMSGGVHWVVTLEATSADYPNATCSYNVFRNNTMTNSIAGGSLVEVQSNSSTNVFDGNMIIGGVPSGSDISNSMKIAGKNLIFRRNLIFDNSGGLGMNVSANQYQSDPPNITTGNRVYNNTITETDREGITFVNHAPSVALVADHVYKNNVIFKTNGNSCQISWTSTNGIRDLFFHNNLIYNQSTTNVIRYLSSSYSISGIQQNYPAIWSNNVQKDPVLDLNHKPVAGSPCIDGGGFLTSVTSNSGTGSSLTVADARYFTDGFGIVTGDTIRVGDDTAVIKKIDYANNTITLDKTVSWEKGHPVSLAYSGSRPDIGAFESGLTGIVEPQPPQTLRVASN